MSPFKNVVVTNPDPNIVYDVIVAGTGPGGSAASRTLSRAGLKILVLEEGPYQAPSSFKNSTIYAMKSLYQSHGLRVAEGDTPFPFILGKGVGGGTLVNSAICLRPPEKSLQRWSQEGGLIATNTETLNSYYDEVENTLGIERRPLANQGQNNILFAEGLKKLGWSGNIIPRNAINCAPCARCFFGCPANAKKSTDKNFLLQADAAGAQLWPEARVEKILTRTKKITGVEVSRPDGTRFTLHSRALVLACGTVGTPRILMSQNLANSSGQVGKNFRCHPTSAVIARFADPVNAHMSIMQGYYSDHFIDDEILLESVWAPSDGIATITPGIGKKLVERMGHFHNFAMAGGMVREEGSGKLRLTSEGEIRVSYQLTANDKRRLTRALYASARMMLAAGAVEILAEAFPNDTINSTQELDILEKKSPTLEGNIVLEGNHPQGTCRMNKDPRRGVVDEFGKAHDIEGLWIMDASAFPSALGVNPQILIMALAIRNSEKLVKEFGKL